jgi:hypothetical protein
MKQYSVKCSCYAEELHIEKFDPNLTEISLWIYAGNGLAYRSLWARIKHALTVLFKGYYRVDWVILNDDNIKELIESLNKSLNETGE